MIDSHNRCINYLRISVTDRCNLRCIYCMPKPGIHLLHQDDILSFEEIMAVVRVAVSLGVCKVRLTGGEPLVRKGIVDLVAALAAIEGIQDLAMTTNGILLSRYARELARVGLHRVNVSLDTTDPVRYRKMTRGGHVDHVLAGIQAAEEAGLVPIKLNCVVGAFSTQRDLESVRAFGCTRGLAVRSIECMEFSTGGFSVVAGGTGGDCHRCNRLRMTSDGFIRPCLFSDQAYSVRKLGIREAIEQAVLNKPEAGGPCTDHGMYSIGG